MLKRYHALLAVTLALAPSFVGAEQAESEAEALRARAQSYWNARIEGTPETAEFDLPVAKGGSGKARRRPGKNVKFESATVESVEVTDDVGVVEVSLRVAKYDFSMMSPQMARALSMSPLARDKRLRRSWVRVDETWYRADKEPFSGTLKRLQDQAALRAAASSSAGQGEGVPRAVRSEEN